MLNDNAVKENGKRIIWISFQILDLFLSKTALIEMATNLSERGNHVDFFALRSKKVFRSRSSNMRLNSIPLKILPIITHLSYIVALSVILPFYIAKRRPRFIITEPKFGSSILSLESKLFSSPFGSKVILDIRSTPVEVHTLRRSLNAFWFNVAVTIAVKTLDGITVATEQMKKEICSKFNANPQCFHVWSNGVDTNLFSPQRYDAEEVRMKLGLTGKFIVFYHGSLRPHGGINETIQSVKILEKRYPDLTLFLLGSGLSLSSFEHSIRKNQLQDRVIIHEPVDYIDVPKYIAMSDVGIVPLPDIPDWRHQSPLKLIEYLAMGKAVIATDIPANRNVLATTQSGIYISSIRPEEIAEAISHAHDNRGKLKEWGSSGRKIAQEKYDWKRVAKDFEHYLEKCERKTSTARWQA